MRFLSLMHGGCSLGFYVSYRQGGPFSILDRILDDLEERQRYASVR